MLAELNVKVKTINVSQSMSPHVKSKPIVCNGIKSALDAFINHSNLLKPKAPSDNYDYLKKKNIVYTKSSPKEIQKVHKKLPKVDLFNYPFNNLVESNCIL
jgi:hypothetical protein